MSAETLLSVGIDLGTTTTQLVFSRLTVRNEGSAFSVPNYTVAAREVLRRSAVHFTPLRSERELDAEAIARIVDAEYAAAGIDRRAVQTGAVIITGETARRENARAVLEALSGYAGDFVVATAGPALESALAGRGAGAADYSQAHACTVVNLDIGGGTTNIARFTNGALTDTACLNVGGRLVKLEPDGRVTYVSPVLRPFVPYAPGDRLTPQDLAPAVSLLTEILEEALGFRPVQDEARLRGFVTDRLPGPAPGAVYSFSGGVADLMDDRPREPFAYGDLGVLLGRAVAKSAVGPRIPARETIRATVIGAGCHATELSGSTVYFDRIAFPLKNLPVAAGLPARQIAERVAVGHTHPALIHNALRFLFDFGEDHAPVLGNAVAAQPQLFLVRRLFERGADEPVIGRIVIYIADGALAMLIRDHPRAERGFERFTLCVCDSVFELPPFKSICAHGGPPLL